MTRFTSSTVDPRTLSMLPHQIARMHPGRREHIFGPIEPMAVKQSLDIITWGFGSLAIILALALILWR